MTGQGNFLIHAFKEGAPVDKDQYNIAIEFDLHVAFANNNVDLNIRRDVDSGILFEGEASRIFVNRGKLVGKLYPCD